MLRQVEQEHNIMRRWLSDDELFQRAREEAKRRQKRTSLHKVHTKVVERWFLLSLKAKYAGMYFNCLASKTFLVRK